MNAPKRIAILGSTGSIGRQALQVIAAHPDRFKAQVLTAGRNAELLVEQARAFKPEQVVIADPARFAFVEEALRPLPIRVLGGEEALVEVARRSDVDLVLVAIVGFSGLRPTLAAVDASKTIALANKETLVVAGSVVMQRARRAGVEILPVDSEHSAIFQCLRGEEANPAEKLLLTASGGPFLRFSKEALSTVTPAQALCHPNWSMGEKITIDSATMINKGFEVIEAHHLFGIAPEKIEVVVHPQSIIHSAVQFRDGAVKAQLGLPDMRLPIQYALSYPERLSLDGRVDLAGLGSLTFERPDEERFPCFRLACESLRRGGTATCTLNAANEVLNLAFRRSRIGFCQVASLMEQVLSTVPFEADPSLETLVECDAESRRVAESLIPS